MNNVIQNNFKCIKTAGGHYALYMTDMYGQMRRVQGIGFASQPFQVVATFPNMSYIAIRRTVITPRGTENRLYLVDTKTGEMPLLIQNGTTEIAFDAATNRFYYSSVFDTNHADFVQLLVRRNGIMPKLQIVNAMTAGTPITVAKRRTKKKTQRRVRARAKNTRKKTMRPLPVRNTRPAISAHVTVPYSLHAQIRTNVRIPMRVAALQNRAPDIIDAARRAEFIRALLTRKLAMANQK